MKSETKLLLHLVGRILHLETKVDVLESALVGRMASGNLTTIKELTDELASTVAARSQKKFEAIEQLVPQSIAAAIDPRGETDITALSQFLRSQE